MHIIKKFVTFVLKEERDCFLFFFAGILTLITKKMKQFKGTKGDWFCRGDKYFVLESKNTDQTIVCTYPTIATINTTFINQAEAEANKNLLVNSKLLLEALQDLVRFCKENEVGAELELAENVINKALD